ncbi:isochorismate synthase [Flavobacterium soyangense]|uniref:isochorismate synthase n=1 Tax=Flavobacterium soyangense TaxID=2023265 RepID=A0A930UCT0_9FLAO|nr:isochorismate synthase [Flavobacterium soyangense]MBF2709029.1 isochorismate synthase [Flavobacterium soyangense]
MEIILDKVKNQFEQNLPFAIYKKPNDAIVIGIFQKNDTLFEVTDFTEKGFVFASFDGSKTVIIPEKDSEIISVVFNKNTAVLLENEYSLPNEPDSNNFKNLVTKGIQAIENNEFKKVVLSRKETLTVDNFDLVGAFEKLVQLYPSTFVYCFFHPKIGIWLGATPERLLKSKNSIFETIALAGTQKDNGSNEVFWHKKEEEEQQFVTDYIVEILNEVAFDILVSKPYSVKAGNIWHIKTDISGVLNSDFGLQQVIQLLHPTPAVCGLPKEQSKVFILENENYDRTFYTGFLGELNLENKTDLFVNLRCMEICESQANLFMGCGITKDSIPEKEWEESINKSLTMKRVL